MVVPLWVFVLLTVCSLLALAGALWLTIQSTPHQQRKSITILRAEVSELGVQVEGLSQRWLAFRTEMETLGEAVEDSLRSAEKKRKRAAADRVKAEKGNGEDQVPVDPAERRRYLARRARTAGFDV